VPFDFCINSLIEDDEEGTATQGCSLAAALPGSALSGTLSQSDVYPRQPVNTGTKQYFVQNNIFNPAGGSFGFSYDGASFTISPQSMSQPTNGAPVAFPSIFIGSNAGGDGRDTPGSNLPRQVGSLTSVPTAWKWTPPANGQYNAAYDVWFSEGSGENGTHNRTFLMVWFDRTGAIFAEGEGEGHSSGIFSIDGKNFNSYVSTQFEGRPIISYVAQQRITEWDFDLLDFINDAKGRTSSGGSGANVIKDSYTLTNIFAGFEVWSGSQGIRTDGFCADVN